MTGRLAIAAAVLSWKQSGVIAPAQGRLGLRFKRPAWSCRTVLFKNFAQMEFILTQVAAIVPCRDATDSGYAGRRTRHGCILYRMNIQSINDNSSTE